MKQKYLKENFLFGYCVIVCWSFPASFPMGPMTFSVFLVEWALKYPSGFLGVFPLLCLGWKETSSLLIAQPNSTQRLAVCSLLIAFSVGCLYLPCSVPWNFNSGPLGNQAVCFFPPEWKHISVASTLQEFFHTAHLVLHLKQCRT